MGSLRHPSAAALEAFLEDRLTAEGFRAVVAHLLRGCRRCQKIVGRLAAGLFLPPRKEVPEEELQFDHAIELAWAAVEINHDEELFLMAHPEEREEKTPELLHARLEKELAESFRHRHSDPAKMVFHAEEAAKITDLVLDESDYPPGAFDDLIARVAAALGNAYRVANRFEEAEKAFKTAFSAAASGSGDELLLAQILGLQASLYLAQRKFELCFQNLERVYSLYMAAGDLHLASRALIKTGIAKGYANQPEEAVALLRRCIAGIDPAREPGLLPSAIHSLASFTVAAGRYQEGRSLLVEHQALLYGRRDEPLELLKLRWIEGSIAAGLGHREEAEAAFQEVRTGFADHRLPDQAAVATMDLALLWAGEGRTAEIAELVAESVQIFAGLGLRRESIAALLVLREAAGRDRLTLSLVQRIAARLRDLEQRPQPKL